MTEKLDSQANQQPNTGRRAWRTRIPGWLVDLIWPMEAPWTPEKEHEYRTHLQKLKSEDLRLIKQATGTEDQLQYYVESCEKLLERERSRAQGVERRLSSVLGMTSIAGAITMAVLSLQLDRSLPYPTTWFTGLTLLAVLYVTVQLLCALIAAVKGVSRRGYQEPGVGDYLPKPQEGVDQQLKRRLDAVVQSLHQQCEVNDGKVTQMAIAHQALQNFLGGILFLVVLITASSLLPRSRDSEEDELLRRIRSNPELIELLRGPPGEPGPPGPPGFPGERGEPGSTVAPPP